MKNYFELNITGRKLLRPVGVMLLATVLFIAAYGATSSMAMAEGMTVVSGRYALMLAIHFVLWCALGVALMWCMLEIMKTTISALTYDGERFEAEYDLGDYLRVVIKGVVLSVITFGIYLPWFMASLMRFYAEGVSHKFNLLSFRSKGMRLLAIVVLSYIVPVMVLALLSELYVGSPEVVDMMSFAPLWSLIITFGWFFVNSLFVVLYYGWCINLTYGDKIVEARMPLWRGALFMVGQMLLIFVTLGLYVPAAMLRMMRYVANHTIVEGDQASKPLRFGMSLRMWRDWGYLWVQTLLLLVTFGIYMPWYYAKVMSRFTSRLYITES